MPITVDPDLTVTIAFKDAEGNESDASFTIRAHLDQDAYDDYVNAVMQVRLDPVTMNVIGGEADLKRAEDVLVDAGLIAFQGLVDTSDVPWPIERWRKLPSYLSRQIVQELQQRNTSAASPNGGAPSASS